MSVLLAPPSDLELAQAIAAHGHDLVAICVREFPDGETYARIDGAVEGRDVWIVCTLHPVRDKFWPASFLAATARELGAARVGLLAPYLAYMRQDSRFREGEALSLEYFAGLLSTHLDRLVTVDPHLHRVDSLERVYEIPTMCVASAPAVAAWIEQALDRPVLIGPDAESLQWVEPVALALGCPFAVLSKQRRGDRDVSVSAIEDRSILAGRQPVILDDIISTGQTMISALERLGEAGAHDAICIGVHAVLGPNVISDLTAAGASRVLTCNTIPHPSNAIDVSSEIASCLAEFEKVGTAPTASKIRSGA